MHYYFADKLELIIYCVRTTRSAASPATTPGAERATADELLDAFAAKLVETLPTRPPCTASGTTCAPRACSRRAPRGGARDRPDARGDDLARRQPLRRAVRAAQLTRRRRTRARRRVPAGAARPPTGAADALDDLAAGSPRPDAADVGALTAWRSSVPWAHARDPAPYLAALIASHRRGRPSPEGFFCARSSHREAEHAHAERETTMSEQDTTSDRAGDVRRRARRRTSGCRSGTSWTRSAPTTTRRAEKRYALTMFPYPCGDLHMGHAEVYALHDVIARYWWQQRLRRPEPDRLGLLRPARRERRDPHNEHPATYTYANIETQAESFRATASPSTGRRRCTPPTRSTTAGPSGCS